MKKKWIEEDSNSYLNPTAYSIAPVTRTVRVPSVPLGSIAGDEIAAFSYQPLLEK